MPAAMPVPMTSAADADRWEALFGCSAPERLPSLVEQAIAWREQVLAHGDVSPAVAYDLRLAVEHALQQRGVLPGLPPASGGTPDPVERETDVPAACGTAAVETPGPAGTVGPPLTTAAAHRMSAAPPSRFGRAVPLPPAASQLLPGSQLVKAHGGRNHVVAVEADGFRYEGAHFTSLSAVAKHITGTHWNGLLFFGLRKRRSYPPKPRGSAQASAHG